MGVGTQHPWDRRELGETGRPEILMGARLALLPRDLALLPRELLLLGPWERREVSLLGRVR